MTERSLAFNSRRNFDMNDLAKIIQLASKYSASIYLEVGGRQANAKSLLGLMSLHLNEATELQIKSEGPDAEAAIEAVAAVLEQSKQ
ncbi:MAG: HPr family phosphocarrier protein [Eubacteriales bacterium]|nr:HPr family phosphocarrier protein [Eubacteriales bacterium]